MARITPPSSGGVDLTTAQTITGLKTFRVAGTRIRSETVAIEFFNDAASQNQGHIARDGTTAGIIVTSNTGDLKLEAGGFAGDVQLKVNASGKTVRVLSAVAANVALTVKGAASQTGDLIRVIDSADAALFAVTAAGLPRWTAAANQQTTVGAAGAASALPSAPTKYLKVVDSAGATLVVPAYTA